MGFEVRCCFCWRFVAIQSGERGKHHNIFKIGPDRQESFGVVFMEGDGYGVPGGLSYITMYVMILPGSAASHKDHREKSKKGTLFLITSNVEVDYFLEVFLCLPLKISRHSLKGKA